MLSNGVLNSLYDEAKVTELENLEEPTGKDIKKLESYVVNKPIYNGVLAKLSGSVSDKVYLEPVSFTKDLAEFLSSVTLDKKLIAKIAGGLSQMDKNAEIQRDKKGEIIYDKDTKDTEIVKWEENIDEYMAREVLPHIPDAKAFFEEKVDVKKPVIKTGAEIPFTRYFYKYQKPVPSEELEAKFVDIEKQVSQRIAKLFG